MNVCVSVGLKTHKADAASMLSCADRVAELKANALARLPSLASLTNVVFTEHHSWKTSHLDLFCLFLEYSDHLCEVNLQRSVRAHTHTYSHTLRSLVEELHLVVFVVGGEIKDTIIKL